MIISNPKKKGRLYFEYHIRLDNEHIVGKQDNFQASLINDSQKYRTGATLFLELPSKNHKSVGYFVSGYYGCEYNIHYDG